MAYDRELADRVRAALTGHAVREVSMFGGLSFMVDEKLAVTANSRGDLMVRCDPARAGELLERDGAQWPEMRGRRMSRGWIVVEASHLKSDEVLQSWIDEALAYNAEVTGTGE
jgi:TfoX/Sxy family transcriptional regulator of competence genes